MVIWLFCSHKFQYLRCAVDFLLIAYYIFSFKYRTVSFLIHRTEQNNYFRIKCRIIWISKTKVYSHQFMIYFCYQLLFAHLDSWNARNISKFLNDHYHEKKMIKRRRMKNTFRFKIISKLIPADCMLFRTKNKFLYV